MTDAEPMVQSNEAILAELAQISHWEKDQDAEQLLRAAIVEGGVLERAACDALRRLGQAGSEACRTVIADEAAPAFSRFSAARILGVVGRAEDASFLVGLLHDPSLAVRRGSAEGLGYLNDPQTVEPLLALLGEEDAPLARSAAFGLMKLGDTRAALPLLASLDHRNPNVRRAAIKAISALDGERQVDQLAAHAHDLDRSVRRALVQALGRLDSPRAVPALLELSSDPAVDIRHEAVSALGRFLAGDAAVAGRLIEALSDRSNPVRRAAVAALAEHKVPRAVGPLCDLLRDGPEPLSRVEAARALGALGDPAAVDRLAQALLVADSELQQAAQEALASILGAVDYDELQAQAQVAQERWDRAAELGGAAIPALVRTMQASDRTAQGCRNRASAALTLGTIGRLGHPEVVPYLFELLEESIPVVRSAAAEALARVGHGPAADKVLGLLDDANPQLREAGVRALGKLGNPAVAERLLAVAQHDPASELRLAAAEALGNLGPGAIPALTELLQGKYDRELRLVTCRSLSALGTVLAIDRLIEALGDADSAVRQTARRALAGSYGWQPIGLRSRRVDAGYARWSLRSEWTTATERVDQVELLIAGLDDPTAERRRAAAETLADLADPRAIPALTAHLADDDVDVAVVVAQSLVALGVSPGDDDAWIPYWTVAGDEARILRAGARALPALVSELDHPEPEVRLAVARRAGLVGGEQVVEPLLLRLNDRYPEVVEQTLASLERVGEKTVRAALGRKLPAAAQAERLSRCAPLLADERGEVRRWAMVALARLDAPELSPLLVGALHDPHVPVVLESLRALVRRRAVDELPTLLGLLRSSGNEAIRLELMRSVAELGGRAMVEPLSVWLIYPDERIAAGAREVLQTLLGSEWNEEQIQALARIVQQRWDEAVAVGPAAIVPLAAVLTNHEQTAQQTVLRQQAAVALGRLGGAPAREVLLGELHDGEPRVRVGVIGGLGLLGDRSVIDAVRGFLGDRAAEVREAAVRTLGKLHAVQAAEDIGRLYRDEAECVRTAVVETLGLLEAPAVLPIVEILEGGDSLAKRQAARSLAQIGDPAAVRYLEYALGDSDFHVREAARAALVQLGWRPIGLHEGLVDEKPARWSYRDEWIADGERGDQVEALRRGLDSDSPLRRRVAAEALAMLGDQQSIPTLTRLAEDPEVEVRMAACQALVTLGVAAEPTPAWAPFWALSGQWATCRTLGEVAVAPLLVMLGSPVARVRNEAARTLGEIASPAAIPGLIGLFSDPSPTLRRTIARALARIGGPAASDALLTAFGHEQDPTLRHTYLEQAVQLGGDLLGPLLDAACNDPAPMVRLAAEEIAATRALFG